MGGNEQDVTRLIIESIEGDASERVKAEPSQEDLRAVEEAALWQVNVIELHEDLG